MKGECAICRKFRRYLYPVNVAGVTICICSDCKRRKEDEDH